MQMIAGGALQSIVGLGMGEATRVDLAAVTWVGWTSLAFLFLFGSILAYTAYVWLLRVTRPELVATYAFVNPVVAVLLAALVAHEDVTLLTLLAAALIVVAVAIVVTARPRPAPPATGNAAAD
jgi:drug/metabolite transporter (DMT)-like permease